MGSAPVAPLQEPRTRATTAMQAMMVTPQANWQGPGMRPWLQVRGITALR